MKYRTIYRLFAPLVKALWRIEGVGGENIPETGAILAANHTAFSDVLVISAAAGRKVRYMAKKELFATPLAPLILALGAYPVDRRGSDVSSIRKTIALVEKGELVGIFPQGHRQGGKDPRKTEIKPGIGMLAYHTKAPIVPVFLSNSRMKTGIFRKNTVTFGAPLSFEDLGFTHGGREEYASASRIIFDHVCALGNFPDEIPTGGEDRDGGESV